jgi:hypothetical protein
MDDRYVGLTLRQKTRLNKLDEYAEIRRKLQKGQYSCEEHMWRLIDAMQELSNELNLPVAKG